MSLDTLAPEAQSIYSDTPDAVVPPVAEDPVEEKPKRAPAKKPAGKKTKTLELTLTVIGTADGEWRAELKQGTTFRHAILPSPRPQSPGRRRSCTRPLHADRRGIEEARSQQAAKVHASKPNWRPLQGPRRPGLNHLAAWPDAVGRARGADGLR